MGNGRISAVYLAEAVEAVKKEVFNNTKNRNIVNMKAVYTAFYIYGTFIVLEGDLHENIGGRTCVVVAVQYRLGEVLITKTAIYKPEE